MLDADIEEKQYKYGSLTDLSQLVLIIFSALFVLVSFSAVYLFLRDVLNPDSLTTSQVFRYLINFTGGIVWTVINWSLAYSTPAVEVMEWGLRLKVFPLKTLEVRWGDIAYIRKARWKPLLYKKYSNIVVVNKGLTWFHRFCGVLYGGSTQPSFVILPNISDYDDLMKVILNGIKKGRRSAQQRRVEESI